MILSAVLGTLSGMARKNIRLSEEAYFTKLYANIWTITIAPSGSFKSTALKKGSRIIKSLDNFVHDEIAAREEEMKQSKTEKRENLSSEIAGLRTQLYELPNQVTSAALLQKLAEGCSGVLFINEFGEFSKNLEKSVNLDLKSLFTTFYDVPDSFTTATKTQDSFTIREPYIAICAVSTLPWVVETMQNSDTESGYFPRFLFFYPPQEEKIPKALPEGKIKISDEIEQAVESAMQQATERQKIYVLSVEAQKVFKEKHVEIYNKISSRPFLMPFAKRWSPYILKLAMLMQPLIDAESDRLGPEAIQGAWSIVNYAIWSTCELYDKELGESKFQSKCRTVMEYIGRQGGEITWGKLLSSKTLKGGSSEYKEILCHLVEEGKIQEEQPAGKGAKAKVLRAVESG
jgi:hypothetical protein